MRSLRNGAYFAQGVADIASGVCNMRFPSRPHNWTHCCNGYPSGPPIWSIQTFVLLSHRISGMSFNLAETIGDF